ncbi:MAG: carboxymuconolactone decarboxylase [Acidimicrobiaceae bacterium]|nr:carboxymuconolactone decarboxylase [Acidimicrobiaceae bacterium]
MSNNADHQALGSNVLLSKEVAAKSHKFAEGYARVREVTDLDGACPAWAKALYMAAAAAVRGHEMLMLRELGRSKDHGLSLNDARGAALTVFISRGEGVYSKFTAAVNELYGEEIGDPEEDSPEFQLDKAACLEYFEGYFGFVPNYIQLMAEEASRALEGYVLMREFSLAENLLDAKHVELLLCTVNAAEFSSRFVNVHANGARNAGATEAEIVESVICALPVSGVASWLPGADGIIEGRG